MANNVVWFDIPVMELERAVQFYEKVLGAPTKRAEMEGVPFAMFQVGENEVGGSLCQVEGMKPSADGPLIYLNVQDRLEDAVAAVAESGGQVLLPKHPIDPWGFRAIILDTEGNRLALHSF
jgi:uncharacterized protein